MRILVGVDDPSLDIEDGDAAAVDPGFSGPDVIVADDGRHTARYVPVRA
jgi:hypothetical protein